MNIVLEFFYYVLVAFLSLLCATIPVVLLIFCLRSKWKLRWRVLLPTLYASAYLCATLDGSYLTGNHGGGQWVKHWSPKYLLEQYRDNNGRGRQEVGITYLGIAFWPLLVADWLIWHPPDDISEY